MQCQPYPSSVCVNARAHPVNKEYEQAGYEVVALPFGPKHLKDGLSCHLLLGHIPHVKKNIFCELLK